MAADAQRLAQGRWASYLASNGLDRGNVVDTDKIEMMARKYGASAGWGRVHRLAEEYNQTVGAVLAQVEHALGDGQPQRAPGLLRRLDRLADELYQAGSAAKATPEDKKSLMLDERLLHGAYALHSKPVKQALGLED